MDIKAKVWTGYGKAAKILGTQFSQYRPSSASNPLSPANFITQLPCAFDDKSNYKFQVPNLYGHPEKFALLDGSQVLVGDYLTDGTQTLFVAGLQRLLPIVCIQCNLTLDVLRPASNTGVGAQPYGGDAVGLETPILTQWAGWIMNGTKGEKSDTGLVGDTRSPWYVVLLPSFSNVQIETDDVLNDNLGRRYKVSAAELTSLGWRLTAMFAGT